VRGTGGTQRSENEEVKTLRLTVDAEHLETAEAREVLGLAAEILRAGGLVALPTETVYGLGAHALDAAAVGRIFEAKQRPAWDPVIVHIADLEMLEGLVCWEGLEDGVEERARRLMEVFWPGPLTLLLRRTSAVPDAVTAGRSLLGVRMPAHTVALELIRRAGIPVAAPSANLFGHTSPTTAEHVLEDLAGRIDAVVDAGATGLGVESTVLDCCQSPMVIYRPGAVTAEQICAVGGAVVVFAGGKLEETPREAMPSPGVGIRHYAPRARLMLVDAGRPDPRGIGALEALEALIEEAALNWPGERVGVMLPTRMTIDVLWNHSSLISYEWGVWSEPEELARNLYAGLRSLDAQGCTVIVCPLPPAEGIGAAIRDRLMKAGNRE